MRAILLFVALVTMSAHASSPVYSELDAEWSADISAKRQRIALLAKKQYGYTLKGSPDDLAIIQRIIDENLLEKTDVVGYQALGVVFGDASASALDAEWKQVADEYGINPVLKIKGKRAAIGALTIISKRIEDKGHVNVIVLYENLVADVRRLQPDFDTEPKK